MGNTAIKSRLNVVMTLSNNKSRLISCNPPPNDYFKHLSNNLWISKSGSANNCDWPPKDKYLQNPS